MQGEKIIIGKDFVRVAKELKEILLSDINEHQGIYFIAIAGESGSGKTGISRSLSKSLAEARVRNIILQQDDYFCYPPKENSRKRREDISWVGHAEVNLSLLGKNIQAIREGRREISKPVSVLAEDRITEETVSLDRIKAVIVEGTYAFVLEGLDNYIFVDRDYLETKEGRRIRAREEEDEFLKKVLEIEHNLISSQKERADLTINNNFEVIKKKADSGRLSDDSFELPTYSFQLLG